MSRKTACHFVATASPFLFLFLELAAGQPSPHIAFPKIADWNSLRMRLERLECYGPCPVYSIEVHGDGRVFYEGVSGIIFIKGHHEGRISHEAVGRLVAGFREADYFSLKDKYATLDTDLPTYVTSIAFDGYKKKVIDYQGRSVGMPEGVERLENLLDQVAGSDKWLRGTAETVPSLQRERWKFRANTSDNDQLFAAAVSRPSLLSLYLENGFPPINSPNPTESPLVSAAYYGSPALLIRLIGNRGSLPAALMARALSSAAEAGDVPTMRFLIAHGANPNGVGGDGDDFSPPLVSAILSGKAAAVNELLKYHPAMNARWAGKDAIDTLFTRTLDQSEMEEILTALIGAGANVNAPDDLYGQTPVFNASGAPNAVDLLRILVKAGANLNATDEFGRTPLSACFDADYARALIDLGADVFARDKQGKTAAETAREMGDSELADLIEKAMASKKRPN
jgi:ankyrin repeat protein